MGNLISLRWYLQLEGLAVVILAAGAYGACHFSGWLFAALFLAPDLFILGYLAGSRTGAEIYNVGHTYCAPAVLIAAGWFASSPVSLAIGLIWCAHIGFDRMLGFGLKYDSGFKATHLQKV
jgi:hypothetical protein